MARSSPPNGSPGLPARKRSSTTLYPPSQLLRQTPGIDPGRIYVLGHSLGATLAPRIGQQDPSIAGLIVMAGMTRSLEDTILDQYTYLYSLSGAMTDEQKAELEQLKVKVARVKDPDLSDQVPAEDLPLGIYPAYWLDLPRIPSRRGGKIAGYADICLAGWARLSGHYRR